MKSLNILNSSLSKQRNRWSPYKNVRGKMVLFYCLQQDISVKQHII